MKTITVRGIDPGTFAALKRAADAKAMSVNRFVLEALREAVATKPVGEMEHHDLDEFFGSWCPAEHKRVALAASKARKIDKYLWQ